MNVEPLSPQSSALEARVVWFAGWTNVTLAAVALMPSWPLKVLPVAAGVALAAALARAYVRRATAFSAALVMVGSAFLSIATVIWLSGLPWRTGISWSQAGRIDRPTAWLFSTATLCLGMCALAAGRLVVRGGQERADLSERASRRAALLPRVSFAGFWIVAFTPVGAAPVTDAAHNVASWAALGAFWIGMLATPWLRRLPRSLRAYSAVTSAVVFFTWLPNGLRFLRLYSGRPISMLAMELVVFPACALWFCWLAHEWSQPTEGDPPYPLPADARHTRP